jgi:hypothetical protein
MMNSRYLEVTFRDGKPFAAYLYLPRQAGDTSARTERRDGGLLIDFASGGRPIGIEITSPLKTSLTDLNRVLKSLDQELVSPDEIRPLPATS